jgi:hypothetical protein
MNPSLRLLGVVQWFVFKINDLLQPTSSGEEHAKNFPETFDTRAAPWRITSSPSHFDRKIHISAYNESVCRKLLIGARLEVSATDLEKIEILYT